MRPEFLEGFILNGPSKSCVDVGQINQVLRQTWGTNWCVQWSTTHISSFGPHLLDNGKLFRVFRLYDDVTSAFVVATKPKAESRTSFQNLRVSGEFYQALSVAVPGRNPPNRSLKLPLEGLRFAVKDMFQIEGLRMTGCNRAYYDLCPIAKETAPIVQSLIKGGAYLLGTLKLGSLVSREEPTESADFHAPFNPRGDGYQSAWSSSSGSGAAIAAYDWLDFTIATDSKSNFTFPRTRMNS
jgi:hypothetical protein